MYKHLYLLSKPQKFLLLFVLFLRDSVQCLRLSMYMSSLVGLSCIYLLAIICYLNVNCACNLFA